MEFFLNISYYKTNWNYGVDYLYFDSVPSSAWFDQNNPVTNDFFGRRTSEYLILGFGSFLRFEIPISLNSFKRPGPDPIWYIGAKAGLQNTGIRFLLEDSILSDPDSLYLPARSTFHSDFVFRLSIARGFQLK